jgi:hypothetical protein
MRAQHLLHRFQTKSRVRVFATHQAALCQWSCSQWTDYPYGLQRACRGFERTLRSACSPCIGTSSPPGRLSGPASSLQGFSGVPQPCRAGARRCRSRIGRRCGPEAVVDVVEVGAVGQPSMVSTERPAARPVGSRLRRPHRRATALGHDRDSQPGRWRVQTVERYRGQRPSLVSVDHLAGPAVRRAQLDLLTSAATAPDAILPDTGGTSPPSSRSCVSSLRAQVAGRWLVTVAGRNQPCSNRPAGRDRQGSPRPFAPDSTGLRRLGAAACGRRCAPGTPRPGSCAPGKAGVDSDQTAPFAAGVT